MGRDLGRIRMIHNVDMGLDALLGDEEGGSLRDATALTLTKRAGGDTQSWKILYWSDEANETCGGLYSQPTCRIYCMADERFSLTVHDGAICLAPTDADDEYQHWIQDTRPGNWIKDMDGYPPFALVNRVTGDAISSNGDGHTVELVLYNPCYLDASMLWTASRDMGHGFRCIHSLTNISMNLDTLPDGSRVCEGNRLSLSHWRQDEYMLWKIDPWCKCLLSEHTKLYSFC